MAESTTEHEAEQAAAQTEKDSQQRMASMRALLSVCEFCIDMYLTLFQSSAFKQSLVTMERMVCQNIYHQEQLQYRDFLFQGM